MTSGEWMVQNSSLDVGAAWEHLVNPECIDGGEVCIDRLIPYNEIILDISFNNLDIDLVSNILDIEIQSKSFDVTLGTNELNIDILNIEKEIDNGCK